MQGLFACNQSAARDYNRKYNQGESVKRTCHILTLAVFLLV